MGEKEQIRPLAPVFNRVSSDGGEAALHQKKKRQKKFIFKCCGCIAAVLLVVVVVVIVLIFTVFKVRNPRITLNGMTVDGLNIDLSGGTTLPRLGSNVTLIADISVKNPNAAAFRYSNTTTTLYYRGTVIGEAKGPAGQARARRTMRMNVTVDVMTDRVMSNPNLVSDLSSTLFTVDSFTRVGGRVKILIVKKHVTVEMNCTVAVNITSRAIQEQRCRRKVHL